METPANKVPVNSEGSAVPERSSKRPGKEEKLKRKDDKSIDQVMKGLNNLETTEEKLAAMCKKFAEVMDENRKLQLSAKQFEKGLNVVQREKEQLQTDHSKAVLTRSRLESLCRELQRQNKAVKEESLLKVREEEEKRKEVSAKFNATLAEITSLMSSSNEKTNKLRDENLDITKKFKSICEQNGLQQQQVDKMNMQRKLEAELSEAKLTKQKLEFTAEKEVLLREKQQLLMDLQEARSRMCDMNSNESALKSQVALYSDRYEEFQNALSRSNEVFGGFKGEMDKMSKKIVKLEKETMSWKNRWEKSHQALLEMATDKQQRDAELALTQRQLAQLQKLCRTLQTERTGLLAQIKGSEKPSDVAVEDAAVSSNGIDVNTDVGGGGGDVLIDTTLVLNGLANGDEGLKVVEQLPEPIKEPKLTEDPIKPKPAVQDVKQNAKSGNKSNKKAKQESGVHNTSIDNSSKVEKSKPLEQDAKAAKKNVAKVDKVDKPIAAEKSAKSKQEPIASSEIKPLEAPLVVEKTETEPPVVAETAKPSAAAAIQDVALPVDPVVVAQLVDAPKVTVATKPETKHPKNGNQKVNKKSKPAESKPNEAAVGKESSTPEVKPTSPQSKAVKVAPPVLVEKGVANVKDPKQAEPEKVGPKEGVDQQVSAAPEKPVSVLLAENIKALEASVGKAETSLKTKEVLVPVTAEKKEPAKPAEVKPQVSPKLEHPKKGGESVEKKKVEQQSKTEKPTIIKKEEQVPAQTANVSKTEKEAEIEKPKVDTAIVAPVGPKIPTMADKVKTTATAKVVDAKPKEVKSKEATIVEKPKQEAQKTSKPTTEVSNKTQEAASVDSKPSSSIAGSAEKPKTPVENTINAILRVLEASIKQKQLPKEPAEPTKVAAENSKQAKEPSKETDKGVVKEPHASPSKGPVKENLSGNASPVKDPTKPLAKDLAKAAPKSPAKGETPKVQAKETAKDAAKVASPVPPKNVPKSPKNDKTPPKLPSKDTPKGAPKEAASPVTPESSEALKKDGADPKAAVVSELKEKVPAALPVSAAVTATEAPVVLPTLPVETPEQKEPPVKVAEPVAAPPVPGVPPASTDKKSAPGQPDAAEAKKVKKYYCLINFISFFGCLMVILYLEHYLIVLPEGQS